MQGPVSPDSLSASSWVRMSSICSRWDGMLVSVTGALSSVSEKRKNVRTSVCSKTDRYRRDQAFHVGNLRFS